MKLRAIQAPRSPHTPGKTRLPSLEVQFPTLEAGVPTERRKSRKTALREYRESDLYQPFSSILLGRHGGYFARLLPRLVIIVACLAAMLAVVTGSVSAVKTTNNGILVLEVLAIGALLGVTVGGIERMPRDPAPPPSSD
jgi:hypothetical protein